MPFDSPPIEARKSDIPLAVARPQRVESGDGRALVRRDRAVDILRGFAIVLMVTSHVGARSRVNTLLHLPLWIFALGLFVGLSGFVVGLRVSVTKTPDTPGLLRRTAQLWVMHCVLTFIVIGVHELSGRLVAPSVAELGGIARATFGVLTLYVQPLDYMNILPLFIVFFLTAPLLALLLQRGWAGSCLGVSAALWVTCQVYPSWSRYTHPTSWPELGALAAWQFAFVLGVVLGFEGTRLKARMVGHTRALLWGVAAVVAAIFVLAQFQRTILHSFGLRLAPDWQWLVSKSELGPLALAYMLGLLYLAYEALWWLEQRGARALEWLQPLETLGRRSLYAFIIHLPLALAASAANLNDLPGWVQEGSALLALLVVYTCARYHVLGRYLPS